MHCEHLIILSHALPPLLGAFFFQQVLFILPQFYLVLYLFKDCLHEHGWGESTF